MSGRVSGFFSNFRNVFLVGLVLAIIVIIGFGHDGSGFNEVWGQAILRYMHVFFGLLWIGLLYYFNFVQIRMMPKIPAELKPAISKYIAPEALFWFRWAALITVILGLTVAYMRGYEREALTFGLYNGFAVGDIRYSFIGLGMWLGIIMMVNVWGVIWPAQKIALGMKPAEDDVRAKAATRAMVFSRINTLLSLPMLACMVMYHNIFG